VKLGNEESGGYEDALYEATTQRLIAWSGASTTLRSMVKLV